MRGPEGKIQDKLVEHLNKLGYKEFYKKNEVGKYFVSSGWPDLMVFPGDGYVFFIEVKAPGEKPTPLQAHKIRLLENKGYTVHLVDNVEYGKRILDKECK